MQKNSWKSFTKRQEPTLRIFFVIPTTNVIFAQQNQAMSRQGRLYQLQLL